MSRSHRALLRVYGADPLLLELRRRILLAEIENPSFKFSLEGLSTGSNPAGFGGFVVKAESQNRPPSFLTVNFTEEPFCEEPHFIVETLHDDEDLEYHLVYSAGKLLYRGQRQELAGDVYELGAPGVAYCQTHDVGVPNAFLLALAFAGVKHRLQPL